MTSGTVSTSSKAVFSRGSFGAPKDLQGTEMLGGAQRMGFHDGDKIADTGLAILVVDLGLLGATEGLAIQGVLVALLDEDDDRFARLVGDDAATAHLALGTLGGLLDVLSAGPLAHLGSSMLEAV